MLKLNKTHLKVFCQNNSHPFPIVCWIPTGANGDEHKPPLIQEEEECKKSRLGYRMPESN